MRSVVAYLEAPRLFSVSILVDVCSILADLFGVKKLPKKLGSSVDGTKRLSIVGSRKKILVIKSSL